MDENSKQREQKVGIRTGNDRGRGCPCTRLGKLVVRNDRQTLDAVQQPGMATLCVQMMKSTAPHCFERFVISASLALSSLAGIPTVRQHLCRTSPKS